MKKIIFAVTLIFLMIISISCGKDSNEVLILTSTDEVRMVYFQDRLNEQFPQYKITLDYLTTGALAARIKAEGTRTDCDIIGELESAYLEGVLDSLADLSYLDTTVFLRELVPSHVRYLPYTKTVGCIVINTDFLSARNLPVPASYNDLIHPRYRGFLSMPSPKSSGTGYFFLKGLVNAWGEQEAFDYFDKFAENVLQFTSSGSGPVNALIQGEAGIALGMQYHVVNVMNERNAPFRILFFEEGSPYTTYGTAVIRGKETRQAVKDVFEFWAFTLNLEDKELFIPDQVFVTQTTNVPNYPQNIKMADMTGIESLEEKERLLDKWPH